MSEESKDISPSNSDKGLSQKPSSTLSGPSKRDSLRPRDSIWRFPESQVSSSPPERFTQNRAAVVDIETANHPRIQDLAIKSAGSTGSQGGTLREQVCLCQPDPKIPRPRNAFILYRQHYQAQIVAQHPGLTNPEISKIIGEQWRNQPLDVKSGWKRLAEEEKQRHHRQYPNYRYQPRRAAKSNGVRPIRSSTPDDPARCPKCNGRYISTPSAPITLFPSLDSLDGRQAQSLSPSSAPSHYNYLRLQAATMNMPRTVPADQSMHRRPGFPPSRPGMQPGLLRERDDEIEGINLSPDQKRRRFAEGPNGYPNPSAYGAPQRIGRPPISAVGYMEERRGTLPSPGTPTYHQNGGMMEPPPRPTPAMYQYSPRTTTHDESLRLPPLQTQIINSVSGPRRIESHQRTDSQARSVEAMVMTIPHISKIKVLSKISPPLAPAGPLSPAQDVRGAVIAIEGPDAQLLAEVGKFIEEYLGREPECSAKTWRGPSEISDASKKRDGVSDIEMTGTAATPTTNSSVPSDPFIAYLETIYFWHEKGSEIKHFTTTDPTPLPPPTFPATNNSPKTSTDPASPTPSPAALPSTPSKPRIPVALLPSGFSLTTSDTFASSIPINDAYAPVDHWQWMATLWRGIIGPDLTVYVKAVLNDREGVDEMSRYGNVEIRNDCAAIIVRVEMREGKAGDTKMGEGRVEDKILRRLGFEVLEFVRGGFGAVSGGFRS